MSARELRRLLTTPTGLEDLSNVDAPLIVVDLDDADGLLTERAAWAMLPKVLAGVGEPAVPKSGAAELVDVAVGTDEEALEKLRKGVEGNPTAATALTLLLRGADERPVEDGLIAESAVYSMLQSGQEFTAWRAAHPPRIREPSAGPAVRTERKDDTLRITLNRPEVHNALNVQMRDELYDALLVAVADPALRVVWVGEGESFCSGGDLDEFGSRPDPAAAHLVRLQRSLPRVMAACSERVQVRLQGSCLGAGIELAAFAGFVMARPDTKIALPELGLGLIPGAGGTVSVTKRVGRHRSAYLALSDDVIDAATALEWGLIDSIMQAC